MTRAVRLSDMPRPPWRSTSTLAAPGSAWGVKSGISAEAGLRLNHSSAMISKRLGGSDGPMGVEGSMKKGLPTGRAVL